MDLGTLGPPATLWRRWTLLAADHAARGEPGAEVRRSDGCAHLDGPDGAWLRMRRLVGDRAVLWGHHPGLVSDARFTDEMRDSAPDWAWDPDTAHAQRQIGFLAWHAHGQWWSVPNAVPAPVGTMLAPVSSDEALVERWGGLWPTADSRSLRALLQEPDRTGFERLVGAPGAGRAVRQVELGASWSDHRLSGTATANLRAQVHAQMRVSLELTDRGHPPRPPLLRQWARVHGRGTPLRHTVCALGTGRGHGLAAAGDDNGLTEAQLRTLDNVLVELRMAETDSHSGAWLFAQVTGDGRTVRMERAYDTWPAWYDGPGPAMADLHSEMTERSPAWRPRWSGLLPTDRF
ncbi:hypothetical protein [Marmoricola endophyticus]|nr:hypothetical protein [Marmoricola endophyticus]